jgi:outer membrane lipoprotein SlyB
MTTGKELLDKVAALKGSSIDVASQKTQGTISGGIIGMAAGAFYGLARKQNLLITSLLGAIAGVVVSRLFMPK